MGKNYFRILAPFTSAEDIKLLKDAGADELYCGYVTEELAKRWPIAFQIINRRGEGQSFENPDTFRKATEQAQAYKLPVYVTINGLYTPEQYPFLLKLVEIVERLEGVKGIIIADLGFLFTLKKNYFKKEIHLSAGGTCFNSHNADFYQNLGVHRIILPRELTSSEIGSIISKSESEIDFEIFILHEPCGGFIDGYCTFFHCYESLDAREDEIKKDLFLQNSYNTEQNICGCNFYFLEHLAKRRFQIIDAASYKQKKIAVRYQPMKHIFSPRSGCRLCDLYDLRKYPVKSLKIVGRGSDPTDIARSVRLVAQIVSSVTGAHSTKREHQGKCKSLFSKLLFNNKYRCTKRDCYFSSLWAENEK